jgi:gas vesicle protein GvpK
VTARNAKRRRRRAAPARQPRRRAVAPLPARELAALRAELARRGGGPQLRWNADPENVQRAVVKLVLTLVDFLRQLFERQAIRRLEAGTLTPAETEALGLALMRLERTVRELARRFRIPPDELNLDLGPLGRLT